MVYLSQKRYIYVYKMANLSYFCLNLLTGGCFCSTLPRLPEMAGNWEKRSFLKTFFEERKVGNAMSQHGNAEIKAIGQWSNFSVMVNQALWSAVKPSVSKGEFDFSKYATVATVRSALRRGFLIEEIQAAASLGLNIGHVPKDELTDLSVWDLKHLYQLFYLNAFGLYLEFPDELMSEASDDFAWPVCVPGIISNEVAFQSGKLDIPRWKYTNDSLDTVIDLSRGRDAWTHSYIVRVRANWEAEADEDMKNLSANDIENKKLNVLMFRERWLLGTFLFWLTGEHLDRESVTLAGSRFRDGGVPVVGFISSDGGVGVGGYHPDGRDDDVRSRQAVSA